MVAQLRRGGQPAESRPGLEPVYVWDLVVRSTHWLIFFSMTVLALTGLDISRPFLDTPPGPGHFTTGWVRIVHSYAAIVFTLSVVARVAWMFLGPRCSSWRQFVPVSRRRRRDMWETLLFYLMVRPRPPHTVGHNPLAGATYILVFALYGLMILTGFALYSVHAQGSYMKMWDFLLPLFGGAQGARWVHHIVMWLLVAFVVHHVFSALLTARVERNGEMDSMFTGYKYLPHHAERDDDA